MLIISKYDILLISDKIKNVLNIKKINWTKYNFNFPININKKEILSNLNSITNKYIFFIIVINNQNLNDDLIILKFLNDNLKKIKIIIVCSLNNLKKIYQQKIDISNYYHIKNPINYMQFNEILFKIKLEINNFFLNSSIPFPHIDDDIIITNHLKNKKKYFNYYHKVLIIQIPNTTNIKNNNKIFKLINNFSKKNIDISFLLIKNNKIILLISTKTEKYFKTRCLEICNYFSLVFFQNLKLLIVVGISKIIHNITDKNIINNSILECMNALKYYFNFGYNTIFFFDEINLKKKYCEFYVRSYSKIENSFSLTEKKLIFKYLKEFIIKLNIYALSKKDCIFQCKIIVVLLMNKIYKITSISINDDFQKIFFSKIEKIFFLKDIYTVLINIINKLVKILLSNKKNTTLLQISKVKEYIKKNYKNNNLSLNNVTEHIDLSISYFSNIFKIQTSMTFVEYLTKIRIEKAKQLFVLTNKLICEVAYDVGFSDAHYFSSIFKKNVGMTPKEYKNKFEKNS